MIETKRCSKCKRDLPKNTNYFNKASANKDGFHYYCKECRGYKFTDYVLEEPKEGFKFCISCKEEKPLTSEFWNKSDRKDGFRSSCKECTKEYDRIWRNENPDAWGEWYKNNKEKKLNQGKKWYLENRERMLTYHKRYYKENKKEISMRRKVYNQKNPHILREWYEKNKHIRAEQNKIWRQNNKELVRGYTQKRLARKKKLDSTLTKKQWEKIKEDFNYQCAYCGDEKKLTREHFIPLSKKGEYTHNNIIPACKSCNSSKGDRDFFEWYPQYKYYSKEREEFILEYLNYKNENIQQLSIL